MKHHRYEILARREEHFSLAIPGSFAFVAILSAALGAFLPLYAALAIGAIAAWIGEHLDRHLVSPVPAWRIFGFAGTFGAVAGWLAALALGRASESFWTTPSAMAVIAALLAFSFAGRDRRH